MPSLLQVQFAYQLIAPHRVVGIFFVHKSAAGKKRLEAAGIRSISNYVIQIPDIQPGNAPRIRVYIVFKK